MAEDAFLTKLKNEIGLAGNNYFDETLLGYIEDAKQFLLDAGVNSDWLSDVSISGGVVTRGAADLWNTRSGDAHFSPYFFQRATQLVYKGGGEDA